MFCELLKHAAWAEEEVRFHHFRDVSGHELDLVIELADGRTVGVEVKASMSVAAADFRGPSSFADYAGARFSHGVLFYSGDKILRFKIDGNIFHALPLSLLGQT